MAHVLLFNKRADSHNAARIHDADCPLVTAARQSCGVVAVIESDAVAEAIKDLTERDWPVKACRCTKGSTSSAAIAR